MGASLLCRSEEIHKVKILDERKMSKWAYYQCLSGNDIPEVRKLITDDYWIYSYCRLIKDKKEMWSKINSSEYSFWYCHDIKDRPEVRKYIK